MIKTNGHIVLNIDDLNTICKYFLVNPKTTQVKERPDLTFTEYCFIDIYTNEILFSFFDHMGIFLFPFTVGDDAKPVFLSSILCKNPEPPSQDILDAIAKRTKSKKSFVARFIPTKKN